MESDHLARERKHFNPSDAQEIDYAAVADIAEDTESIYVEPSKETENNGQTKQRVDFLNQSAASSLFNAQSKRKIEEPETSEYNTGAVDNDTGEETQQQQQPNQEDALPKPEELYDVSYVIMEFFDAGVSNICSAVSMGMKPVEFELNQSKKQQLARSLSVILAKHQVKMSIEMLFVVSLALAYSTPVKKAVNVRKAKKERMKQEAEKVSIISDDSNEANTPKNRNSYKNGTR